MNLIIIKLIKNINLLNINLILISYRYSINLNFELENI
jgi:hypothetical protein